MSQLLNNTTGLQEILEALADKAAGGSDPVLQDKTVDPTTSQQTITADSEYDGLNTVTVNAMPTTTQATPTISINSTGLITASVTQGSGYVSAGTKSATKQLAFQAAKTITPSTTSQVAVSSGYYTGGNVTVAGDANLVAGNIKSGTSIFGVTGTYEGSGGSSGEAAEWSEAEDAMVKGTLSVYTNDRVTSIGSYAFYSCSSLTSISFPNVTSIGSYAFASCTSLTSISFPNATSIGSNAFFSCNSLTSGSFPNVTSIKNHAFFSCTSLTSISFPNATSIGSYAFFSCRSLTSISFPNATSIGSNAFFSCNSLTSVSFPNVTSIKNHTFACCSSLTSISFPNVTSIGSYAFASCTSLTSISFPNVTSIGSYAFYSCCNLTALYLIGSSICTLSNSNAFASTPIGGYSASAGTYGSIYVPRSLLASYQAATNWTYFSSRFVGIEDGNVEVPGEPV